MTKHALKKWITPRSAANTLGVSVARVRQLAYAGQLRFRRVDPIADGTNGRPVSINILRADCVKRLASRSSTPTPESR